LISCILKNSLLWRYFGFCYLCPSCHILREADHAQRCLDLWSTGEDDIRIAAFLAIRRLASSTEGSIVDLVLKVHRSLTSMLPLLLMQIDFTEYILDTCPCVQVYEHLPAAIPHAHEEFGMRTILHRPRCNSPARVRVHTSTCHTPAWGHEDKNKGKCMLTSY
jgi:hypothetical protein